MTSDRPRKLAQTVVSLCVLAALAGVAVGLFIKQSRFDSGRPEHAAAAAMSFEHLLPDALMPMSPPERFTPATLWKKIDGAAEFYIDAGLAELSCQRFALAASPADWLELYVYDMAEWEGALAVFTPREGATAVDLTDRAYESGGSLFFVHGRYYVEVRAAQPTEQLAEAGMALARNFVAETRIVTAGRLDPAKLFPQSGLVPDSIRFKKSNVFGLAELDNVWLADYEIDGVKARAFISCRDSAEDGERVFAAYLDFLGQFGAERAWELLHRTGVTDRELSGNYYYIFYSGRFVGGVHECPDQKTAHQLAYELHDHVGSLQE